MTVALIIGARHPLITAEHVSIKRLLSSPRSKAHVKKHREVHDDRLRRSAPEYGRGIEG